MPGSRLRTDLEPIRRFEVVTGVGRRRTFAVEEKLALVAQIAGCGNICDLARRHDLRPSQLAERSLRTEPLVTLRKESAWAALPLQAGATALNASLTRVAVPVMTAEESVQAFIYVARPERGSAEQITVS